MTVTVKKSAVSGKVIAPPSKSFAHRMLICAALSSGKTILHGISKSEDILATLDCIKALGADVQLKGDTAFISGGSVAKTPIFDCRESGSTLRFFIPVACALTNGGVFKGSNRLIERGIGVYEEIFAQCGINIEKCDTKITVNGSLKAGKYTVRGDISSQFITGLIFALSVTEGESIITVIPPFESRRYVDITVETLRRFGAKIEAVSDCEFKISGVKSYNGGEFTVEGDYSNAAFWLAFKALGNNIEVTGLKENSLQGDRVCADYFERIKSGETLDISDCPDLGPILFAVSAALNGGKFTGTKRLKIKESDRAEAMKQELKKFGAEAVVGENSVEIKSGGLSRPTEILCGHNDHRIVMSLAVLATITGGMITDAQAVNKSYPEFFKVLETLGGRVQYEDR